VLTISTKLLLLDRSKIESMFKEIQAVRSNVPSKEIGEVDIMFILMYVKAFIDHYYGHSICGPAGSSVAMQLPG
jgi:hypothetical protein